MSSGQELRQCVAITESGERCSRPARDGEFCYQHDESDEVIDDIEDDGEQTEEEEGESSGDGDTERAQKADAEGAGAHEQKADSEESMEHEEMNEAEEVEGESADAEDQHASSDEQVEITRHEESAEEEAEAEEAPTDIPDETVTDSAIKEIRERAGEIASQIVGYPFDGIARLAAAEDGWVVAIEVVERSGVPDTQDIIGRYELQLDEDLQLAGYHRTDRYRRDDMEQNR